MYLRENPDRKKMSENPVVETTNCAVCKIELKAKDVRIDTPKYGTLCLDCWSTRVGEFVEKNPVSERKSYAKS